MASPDCADCGGSGYVDFAVKFEWVGHERQILEALPLPPGLPDMYFYEQYPLYKRMTQACECIQAQLAARRMARIMGDPDIPDDCYRYSFADFEGLAYAAVALDYAKQLTTGQITDKSGVEKPGMLIVGPTGTGKTTLSSLVFRVRVEAGALAVWMNVNRLFRMIRDTYEEDYAGLSQNEIISGIEDADFLVLDDLGSATRSMQAKANGLYFEDAIEAIRRIADHRLVKHLPTIVSTNLGKEQMYAQFGDRAISRIRGLCHAVPMISGDFRVPANE